MIHAAVGIIRNAQNQILIAQRLPGKYKSGLWEFPGGKVEPSETILEALVRELKEEIGIIVLKAENWLSFTYDYSDRIVLLDTYLVTEFEGEPHGVEGQPVRWVSISDLNRYEFPAGNQKIIEKLIASK